MSLRVNIKAEAKSGKRLAEKFFTLGMEGLSKPERARIKQAPATVAKWLPKKHARALFILLELNPKSAPYSHLSFDKAKLKLISRQAMIKNRKRQAEEFSKKHSPAFESNVLELE